MDWNSYKEILSNWQSIINNAIKEAVIENVHKYITKSSDTILGFIDVEDYNEYIKELNIENNRWTDSYKLELDLYDNPITFFYSALIDSLSDSAFDIIFNTNNGDTFYLTIPSDDIKSKLNNTEVLKDMNKFMDFMSEIDGTSEDTIDSTIKTKIEKEFGNFQLAKEIMEYAWLKNQRLYYIRFFVNDIFELILNSISEHLENFYINSLDLKIIKKIINENYNNRYHLIFTLQK